MIIRKCGDFPWKRDWFVKQNQKEPKYFCANCNKVFDDLPHGNACPNCGASVLRPEEALGEYKNFIERLHRRIIKGEKVKKENKVKVTIKKNQHRNVSRLLAKKFRALDRKIDGRIDYEKKKREYSEEELLRIARYQVMLKTEIDYLCDSLDELQEKVEFLSWTTVAVVLGLLLIALLR